jgi:hypothetical protein
MGGEQERDGCLLLPETELEGNLATGILATKLLVLQSLIGVGVWEEIRPSSLAERRISAIDAMAVLGVLAAEEIPVIGRRRTPGKEAKLASTLALFHGLRLV